MAMTRPLNGTVALVTGASSGIGAATARALAAQGAAVALAARRVDLLQQLSSDIAARGGRTLVLDSDVTDSAQAESAVDRTVRELGATRYRDQQCRSNAARADRERAARGVGANGEAQRARRPLHRPRGAAAFAECGAGWTAPCGRSGERELGGRPRRASQFGSVQNLTKFGIGAFSESLRQEVTGRHVRVSLVEPGAVDTE